ncbi:MAG: hypothetical protein GY782_10480 [Gammaproteobacteria bacterium]|nr:hypothetical protein [Gammaproteobacteria bacterium]
MKFRELMKSLVPWPFRQTGRLKICAYCGLRASAFGFPWPAAQVFADKHLPYGVGARFIF